MIRIIAKTGLTRKNFSIGAAARGMGLAVAFGLGCGPASSPSPETGVVDVAIQNTAFSPNAVTLKKGEFIRWTNHDFVTHTATSGNPGDANAGSAFDTGDIRSGQSSMIQFNNPGDFIYFCEHHPLEMKGAKVSVTE